MGAKSRRKGKRGEIEVAQLLRALIPGLDAQRSYHQAREGGDAPDVDVGDLPLWLEVKLQARPNIGAAVKQAIAARGDRPVWAAAFTRADRGEWLVTMTAEDWCDLVREWWERSR
jgi:hypothetical protein